jgi:hypothetical protein
MFKQLILGSALAGIAVVALPGIAMATDVDATMTQGCTARYTKTLHIELVNHDHEEPLLVNVYDSETGNLPITLAKAGTPGDHWAMDFSNLTSHGDGGIGRDFKITSATAHLHGTLTGNLNWTQYECGPPHVATTVPPATTITPVESTVPAATTVVQTQVSSTTVTPDTATAPPTALKRSVTTPVASLPPTGNSRAPITAGVGAVIAGGFLLLITRRRANAR